MYVLILINYKIFYYIGNFIFLSNNDGQVGGTMFILWLHMPSEILGMTVSDWRKAGRAQIYDSYWVARWQLGQQPRLWGHLAWCASCLCHFQHQPS